MATLKLFAQAREAANSDRMDSDQSTIAGVLDEANERYGQQFASVVSASSIWLNGNPAELDSVVCDGDEVAIIPPLSGG